MTERSDGLRPLFIVAMLTLFMILSFADRAVLGFAAVPIMRDLGMTPVQFGLAASSMYWLYPIAGIAGGFAVTRYPAKWVLTVLATIWALSQIPMLWATTTPQVIVSRALLGVGEGPAFAVVLHACFKWFEDRDRAIPASIVSEGAAFGIIFASPVVAFILAHYGWRAGFGTVAVVTLVWVVVWALTGSEGKVQTAARAGAELARVPYLRLLLDRTFIGNTLAGFAVACGITIFLSWLPPFLVKGLGYSVAEAGWLTTLPWIASIVLVICGSVLSQRLLQRAVPSRVARGLPLCIALGLGGASILAMSRLEAGGLQMLLLAVGFGLPTLVWTLSPAIIGEVTPVAQRGAMLGVFSTVANTAGGSLAPTVMGIVVQHGATEAQGYANGFTALGCLQIVFSILAWALIRPEASRARFAVYGMPKATAVGKRASATL